METYDFASLYQYLKATPEKGLKGLLKDPKFTDAHIMMLLKIVRSSSESEFCQLAEKGEFPKVKYTPVEYALKEKFWNCGIQVFLSRGVLTPMLAQKLAA